MRRPVVVIAVLAWLQAFSVAPLEAQEPKDARGAMMLQFWKYTLDSESSPKISVTATAPLREVMDAVRKKAPLSAVHYAPTVKSLDTICTVNVNGETVERTLQQVLSRNGLAFVVTGLRTIFVYPDTPAERQRYEQTTREFTIVKGNPSAILATLNIMAVNKELPMEPFGQLPEMATDRAHTIMVRATADVMNQIAKVIAANDK